MNQKAAHIKKISYKEAMSTLQQMFPKLTKDFLHGILLENKGNFQVVIEKLLTMGDKENQQENKKEEQKIQEIEKKKPEDKILQAIALEKASQAEADEKHDQFMISNLKKLFICFNEDTIKTVYESSDKNLTETVENLIKAKKNGKIDNQPASQKYSITLDIAIEAIQNLSNLRDKKQIHDQGKLETSLKQLLKEQQEKLILQENLCIICLENPITHAPIPCGHLKYCEKCIPQLMKTKTCCYCKQTFQTICRIYK